MARLHRVEVDQSGRLDQSGPVVIALSNGLQDSVIMLGGDKSRYVRKMRTRTGMRQTDYLRAFSALLFILLEPHLGRLDSIVIDTEYDGHGHTIRNMLMNHVRNRRIDFDAQKIGFESVGKHSPAHHLAIDVFRQHRPPGKKVTAEQLLALT